MKCESCIDVDDVRSAVHFYGQGIGLSIVQEEDDWAHLKVGDQTIWIMKSPSGPAGAISRDYARHWTPVHLDFHVDDLEEAVKRALAAGGRLEGRPKATLANLVDPPGNGVDLVQTT